MRLHQSIDELATDLAHVRTLLSASAGNVENAGENAGENAAARLPGVEGAEHGFSPQVCWAK